MKNTLNTAKHAAKKQLKNVALASTLIATLASCGGNEKKADSTPTDTTKVETVVAHTDTTSTAAKSQTTKTESQPTETESHSTKAESTAQKAKEEQEIREILKALDDQAAKEKQEAKKNQTPREKRGVSKEARDYAFNVFKESEAFLINFENDTEEFWQYKKGLDLVKRCIDDYLDMAADLNQPINPKAQKVINKYKQAIKAYKQSHQE